jgi:hypothetical protein
MQRRASSNWPSCAYVRAKYDNGSDTIFVAPVERYEVIPELINRTVSTAFPVTTLGKFIVRSSCERFGTLLGVGIDVTRLLLKLVIKIFQVVGAGGTVIAGTRGGIAPSNTGNNLLRHLPGLPMAQQNDLMRNINA